MNFGTSSQVVARGSKGATSYLQFALPAAPVGKTLKTATLVMRTSTATESGAVNSVPVTVIADAWSESTVTWATRPALTSTVVGSFPAGTKPDTSYSVALLPNVMASAQGKSIGIALSSTSTDNLRLWSTGHASPGVHPRLVLTYG
jgi:hypothetical protein